MTLAAGKCLKALLFPRRKRRVRAQTTVEFALICLPFFAILFAIIDFAQIYFYENACQNALREAARFATAGRIIQLTNGGVPQYTNNSQGFSVPKAISDSHGREASRNTCIMYWFQSNCVLVNFPLSNIVITSAPSVGLTQPWTSTNSHGDVILVQTNGAPAVAGPGNASDYVQIAVTYQVHTITPLVAFMGGWSRKGWNVYPVYVSAIVKNEPALLNFQHTNMYSNEPQ